MSVVLAAGGALALDNPSENEILRLFVARAGGAAARLVLVTIASAVPEATAAEYTAVFQTLGVRDITVFDLEERSAAADSHLDAVHQATGIYLSGGNQLRLTTLVNGTAVGEALHAAHRRGVVFLGSSAGTAV